MSRAPGAGRPHGFTLIELMIVVTVLAILAAVSITSYSSYVTRSKRAAARQVLLEAAQLLERNYTVAGCYQYATPAECRAGAGTAVALPNGLNRAPKEGNASYSVSVSFATAQSFALSAIPCGAAGSSCNVSGVTYETGFTDPTCGTLGLSNNGTKSESGTSDLNTCWQR